MAQSAPTAASVASPVSTAAAEDLQAVLAVLTLAFAGAARWLSPRDGLDGDGMMAVIEEDAPQHRQQELFEVFEQMARAHPAEPHWHFPLIGVDPAQQGNGLGSALLRHALARCDREETPAYLEATSPRNVPLYERHGFEVVETIRAGGSPPLFPMTRRPLAGLLT